MAAHATAPPYVAPMKAAYFERHGGPDVVQVGELPDPTPGPGEVLIRVRAAGLNHLDLWVRRGLPGLRLQMPHIGGSDMAGEIVALGDEVTGWAAGDRVAVNPGCWCARDDCEWCVRGEHPLCLAYRVLGEHLPGGFAEWVAVPGRNLVRLPDGFPFATAAVAPLVYQTAWRGLLSRGRLAAGETVLITGASGGVSTAAIQIAKHHGARVFAVTSGPENVRRVEGLGADLVIDRLAEDFWRRVWAETGKRGVDLVLDSVGEVTWEGCVRSLSRGGRMVVYGATTGPRGVLHITRLFWTQPSVLGTTMATQSEFDAAMALVLDGTLEPIIDDVWPLDRAREAHEHLEAGGVFGKLVLTP